MFYLLIEQSQKMKVFTGRCLFHSAEVGSVSAVPMDPVEAWTVPGARLAQKRSLFGFCWFEHTSNKDDTRGSWPYS